MRIRDDRDMNRHISASSIPTALPGTAIDPKRFRSLMSSFATGVAIVATECDGELFGATVNSLTSVSLSPCMLLFCTAEGSATGTAIQKRGFFSVNILGQHQSDVSARFTATGQ